MKKDDLILKYIKRFTDEELIKMMEIAHQNYVKVDESRKLVKEMLKKYQIDACFENNLHYESYEKMKKYLSLRNINYENNNEVEINEDDIKREFYNSLAYEISFYDRRNYLYETYYEGDFSMDALYALEEDTKTNKMIEELYKKYELIASKEFHKINKQLIKTRQK